MADQRSALTGHGGIHAVAAAMAHGVDTMFTLSGAHVFPLYDAAVGGKDGAAAGSGPIRLIDVRHEQTAVFAAEGLAKLTRTPGLAVVTAGPGVTNAVSAVTTAHFNGSPVVVLGGRAPDHRWGTGALQELDQPPLLAPVTKHAATVHDVAELGGAVDRAFTLASAPHRGPVFLDVPMDALYSHADAPAPAPVSAVRTELDSDAVDTTVTLLTAARRPVLVLGGDVWSGRAERAAGRLATTLGIPVVPNGMGRGVIPAGHRLLAARARRTAFTESDLVIVVGTPLDFRLGYGVFGAADVVHIVDHADQVSRHATLAASISGDLTEVLDALRAGWESATGAPSYQDWADRLADLAAAAAAKDRQMLTATADPIHPGRIYGELLPRLAEDAVVIGDGGDFVSFAGRFVEPARPGGWLDPGPYGCLGTGLGYAIAARLARPDSQVVLLLGDGAAGFSLIDVDSLVRHDLPVVMVMGNNGGWGLEKHPMQFLYSYDVAAELRPGTRYDQVVTALGGAGELVTDPEQIGPAMDRAFAADVPYLVNVVTDPAVAYPRTTTGV
ncbi:MAG TPA: acetolactate synthase [Candidatus Nanopelagicales bacterium]|nr:acetolactate synthase [Candidatus Nanopelagicales bacterium]